MNKKCICVKDWREFKVGEEVFYKLGFIWYVGGIKISVHNFRKHFKPI